MLGTHSASQFHKRYDTLCMIRAWHNPHKRRGTHVASFIIYGVMLRDKTTVWTGLSCLCLMTVYQELVERWSSVYHTDGRLICRNYNFSDATVVTAHEPMSAPCAAESIQAQPSIPTAPAHLSNQLLVNPCTQVSNNQHANH